MRSALVILVLAAGCSMGADGGNTPDATNTSDAGPGDGGVQGCAIGYDPMDPVASSVLPIRAFVNVVNPTGIPTYSWTVTRNSSPVAFTQQAADGSQIGFIAATPGPYVVRADITNVPFCSETQTTINVEAPGANIEVFRLRTVPASSVPPQETLIQVKGGADAVRPITLQTGLDAIGFVKNSATSANIAAYLKFMPRSMPTAFSERFASSATGYSLKLVPLDHDVLVIPGVAGLAPKLVTWTAFTTDLLVGPGNVTTGTVRGPSGAGFAGANVQLYAGGVPSTSATTAADGSYSVRSDFPTGATQITVKVTPPPGSGLPRLEATSAFNLASALNVTYAASLTTCDLANTPVRRGGVNQPNAQVNIVGGLAGVAGSIGGVNATNSVRVSATADGAGQLPSTLVPRGSLSAVTELSMSDHAISAIDTSGCSVAQINAPAMTTINGTTRYPNNTAIGGVRAEAEPIGVLALAGVAPIQVVSNASGAFALPLAGGGRYNVRFIDPQQRVASLVANDVATTGVPTNALMPKALAISGTVTAGANLLLGASIQILCATCLGLEAARPIAETASDSVGKYLIAVPDPGTM
ncbi:MAG TPA: carboxypeptidase-like regulatory domain-containing protein [Kofleriaceae bacterium]